jgi:hypothetical protein
MHGWLSILAKVQVHWDSWTEAQPALLAACLLAWHDCLVPTVLLMVMYFMLIT